MNRLKTWQAPCEETLHSMKSGSMLVLHVEPTNKAVLNYGKGTYNPLYEQSDEGYSKFFSILKYLVS